MSCAVWHWLVTRMLYIQLMSSLLIFAPLIFAQDVAFFAHCWLSLYFSYHSFDLSFFFLCSCCYWLMLRCHIRGVCLNGSLLLTCSLCGCSIILVAKFWGMILSVALKFGTMLLSSIIFYWLAVFNVPCCMNMLLFCIYSKKKSVHQIVTTCNELRKVLFLVLSVTSFVCVWNISGTLKRICTKFTGTTCLVLLLDVFECQCQRSRSPGTINGIFQPFQQPACGLCLVKHL